jgi:hypothetical protein
MLRPIQFAFAGGTLGGGTEGEERRRIPGPAKLET